METKFASGSGYFISKDLIKIVITNKNKWKHGLIDDVALGVILNKVKIFPAQRFDVKNIHNIDMNHYHYRVKTPQK